jgi:hypothetical protein
MARQDRLRQARRRLQRPTSIESHRDREISGPDVSAGWVRLRAIHIPSSPLQPEDGRDRALKSLVASKPLLDHRLFPSR